MNRVDYSLIGLAVICAGISLSIAKTMKPLPIHRRAMVQIRQGLHRFV